MAAVPAKSAVTFSARGHGSRSAYCSGLEEEVEIESSSSETKNSSDYYPRHVIGSGFSVTVSFRSGSERNSFTQWMYEYALKLGAGTANSMQVTIPAVGFTARGVPIGSFPRRYQAISSPVKTVDVKFERLDEALVRVTADPEIPFDAVVATFYPTGVQQVGPSPGEDSLYDFQQQLTVPGSLSGAFGETYDGD